MENDSIFDQCTEYCARLGAGYSYDGSYEWNVEPEQTMLDVSVAIRLSGAAIGQPFIFSAQVIDEAGIVWISMAVYQAAADGMIDITRDGSQIGTYEGIEPMGLFWSLVPRNDAAGKTAFTWLSDNPIRTLITVTGGGVTLARLEVERMVAAPASQVTCQTVTANGLVGNFFYPNGPGPYPAVIVISGSDARAPRIQAAVLAAHGYTTLALQYVGAAPLPQELVRIPLEYFKTAIDWVSAQEVVDFQRIGLLGWSKGGEAAMIVGVTYPEVRAVVAYTPSAYVWQGTSSQVGSSWTYCGAEVPYIPIKIDLNEYMRDQRTGNPYPFLRDYTAALDDPDNQEIIQAAAIPVEKINGPVLLFVGTDDQLWPARRFGDVIVERRVQYHTPYGSQQIVYLDAGHHFSIMPSWTTNMRQTGVISFGGGGQADASASDDAWRQMLTFLSANL